MSFSKTWCFALLCAVMFAPACAKKSEVPETSPETTAASAPDAAVPDANAADTAKADASAPASYNKGDIITFGHYEQDNDTSNGKEPITWRVLDKNDEGHILIISEKVLDVQPYNATHIFTRWDNSTIRSWLNGYDDSYNAVGYYDDSYNTVGQNYTNDNFIDAAFTAEEKAKIIPYNLPEVHYRCTGSDLATTDKIFLLMPGTKGVDEVSPYFSSEAELQADATNYAISKGIVVDGTTSNGMCTSAHCYAPWWLRFRTPTTGSDRFVAAYVNVDGKIDRPQFSVDCRGASRGGNVDRMDIGVRPALWVKY